VWVSVLGWVGAPGGEVHIFLLCPGDDGVDVASVGLHDAELGVACLEVLLGEECLAGCLAAQVEHQTVEHSIINIRGIECELLVPVRLGIQAVCHALGLGHCLTFSTTLRPQGDAVVRHGREGCQLPTSKTMRAARTWRQHGG
jgi:hypothetical protein